MHRPADSAAGYLNEARVTGPLSPNPMPVATFDPAVVEVMARATHERYRVSSPDAPLGRVSYEELSDDDREANRALVRAIPAKLAAVGLAAVPTGSVGPDLAPVNQLADEVVDELAVEEHARWLAAKAEQGFVYGAVRDEASDPKTHPDMVPWSRDDHTMRGVPPGCDAIVGPGELTEAAREKDRAKIREIPALLAAAGFVVVRKP